MKIGVMILAALAMLTLAIDNFSDDINNCTDGGHDPTTTVISDYENTSTEENATSLAYTTSYADEQLGSNWTQLLIAAVWVLVGIGGVIAAILLIAAITCIILTAIVAKGIRYLIQYYSTSARANGE